VIDYDAETASSAAGGVGVGGGGGGGFCERYAGQACSQFIGNRSVFMRSRLEQRLVEEQLTGALYAMHFACPATTLLKDEESTRDNHVLACNICQIFADLKKITGRLSNTPFLIWLLTTPPHLQCVATLPCNLSLMACFADINVSQGSAATYARCGGIFNVHITTNLRRKLSVKIFFNRSRFDRIMVMSLWPHFLAHHVHVALAVILCQLRSPT